MGDNRLNDTGHKIYEVLSRTEKPLSIGEICQRAGIGHGGHISRTLASHPRRFQCVNGKWRLFKADVNGLSRITELLKSGPMAVRDIAARLELTHSAVTSWKYRYPDVIGKCPDGRYVLRNGGNGHASLEIEAATLSIDDPKQEGKAWGPAEVAEAMAQKLVEQQNDLKCLREVMGELRAKRDAAVKEMVDLRDQLNRVSGQREEIDRLEGIRVKQGKMISELQDKAKEFDEARRNVNDLVAENNGLKDDLEASQKELSLVRLENQKLTLERNRSFFGKVQACLTSPVEH